MNNTLSDYRLLKLANCKDHHNVDDTNGVNRIPLALTMRGGAVTLAKSDLLPVLVLKSVSNASGA